MALVAEQVALEVVDAVAPLLGRVRKEDPDLHKQLRRALCSVAMNIAEGQHSDDGNRRARYFTAAGSANETRMALRLAQRLGYISERDWARCDVLLVRQLKLLWGLTRGRAK